MKPIILRTRTSTDECIGTVRLTPEAEKVLMAIEDSLREVGANREANGLSTIIARLEAWQNK